MLYLYMKNTEFFFEPLFYDGDNAGGRQSFDLKTSYSIRAINFLIALQVLGGVIGKQFL
jgi:hypothetical protein